MAVGANTPNNERSFERVGVFGGTFDPIHIGHLVVAEEARVSCALDRVIFIPAKKPPHKPGEPYASAGDRLEMVRLAIADNPYFCVSGMELERAGPSYTVDTLRAIREECLVRSLFFIMGADSLVHLKTWRDPHGIMQLARLIAVTRPDWDVDLAALDRELPGLAANTELLTTVRLEISSTDLRERVSEGRPIRYQVPDQVEAYIREHGLYIRTSQRSSAQAG
ncbi:MAG: nicotinate-nucleotide adenylyltransferase [Chloroflexi bacterium]|jgi:nicotinate-nucleotide adenylyltransferase|nr:nicotinate-nucleotide adenylyltransferase [Chloroflexota bacterium]